MNSSDVRADQALAALCHLAVFVPLFGLIVPLLVWVAADTPPILRRHAQRAFIYQGAALALNLLLYGCYVIGLLGVTALVAGQNPSGDPEQSLVFVVGLTTVTGGVLCAQGLGSLLWTLGGVWQAGQAWRAADFS